MEWVGAGNLEGPLSILRIESHWSLGMARIVANVCSVGEHSPFGSLDAHLVSAVHQFYG